MTSFDKTNVIVSGSRSAMGEYANYTTVIPKPTLFDGHMVLTQSMISKPNTKYVVKWNFELAEDITIPANCILEFDGGSINGEHILYGNKTIVKEYKKPGNALWSGEFITEDGRHISNHYKTAQKNNIHLTSPWGYYGTDKNMNNRMAFQRRLGFDFYHFTLAMDVNVDANGLPTSIIWRSKDLSVNYNSANDVANALVTCINNNKLGVFDGIKMHTEYTNIDTILRGSDTEKIVTFLNLYKDDITTILAMLGSHCSEIKYFFILNEEPQLMANASNNSSILNALFDIRNVVKNYCSNATISISACIHEALGYATKSLCYTDEMLSLVDACGVNYYMNSLSFLGKDSVLDSSILDDGVAINKNNLDYLLGKVYKFFITETGCSNKEISLARGAYWNQETTNSMDYPLQAAYLYFVAFFKMLKEYDNRVEYLAHWFLNPYYFENGVLKDFYGNVYSNTTYAEELINTFKNNLYE